MYANEYFSLRQHKRNCKSLELFSFHYNTYGVCRVQLQRYEDSADLAYLRKIFNCRLIRVPLNEGEKETRNRCDWSQE